MFTINKYHKIYFSIIQRAQSRILNPNTYVERHHIIPKSLGGSNDISNLVKLTAREHAICHLLLIRFTNGENKMKMACAAWRMMFNSKTHSRYKLSSRAYNSVRIEMANATSIRSSNYKHSEESKRKISESKIGRKRNITPEWREKIVSQLRGRKIGPPSDEHRRKNSVAHLGVKKGPPSDEHRQKISESKKGKKLMIDPATGRRYYTKSPG